MKFVYMRTPNWHSQWLENHNITFKQSTHNCWALPWSKSPPAAAAGGVCWLLLDVTVVPLFWSHSWETTTHGSWNYPSQRPARWHGHGPQRPALHSVKIRKNRRRVVAALRQWLGSAADVATSTAAAAAATALALSRRLAVGKLQSSSKCERER